MPNAPALLQGSKFENTERQIQAGQEIEFLLSGVTDRAATVKLVADGGFPLGSASQNAAKKWALSTRLNKAGLRRIEAQVLDASGIRLDEAEITIQVGLPQASQTTRSKFVAKAVEQLGRSPQGEVHRDVVAYTQHALDSDWCVQFIAFVYRQATSNDPRWGVDQGQGGTSEESGRREAWVPDMAAWAKANGMWLRENDPHSRDPQTGLVYLKGQPRPGDLLIFGDLLRTELSLFYPHIGIIERVEPQAIHTIEGNTGTSDSLTSVVARREHSRLRLPNPNQPSMRYIAGYVQLPEPQ